MTREEYIQQCLADAVEALSVKDLPTSIQIGDDWIYPKVAMHRLKSIQNVDKLFPKED
jgi:hypothetical protein